MSYNKPRIQITDSLMDMLQKMSGGNPGALTVLMKTIEAGPKIDPQSALGPISALLSLDTLDIYDSKIWILYKDVCGQDMVLMLALLRAVQMGIMSESGLHDFIAYPRETTDARKAELLAAVKEQLVEFGVAS